MVDAATAAGSTSAVSSGLGRARLAENFDTFLTLLTTQLKNQDPLSPMDSNDFTQQMVQMTGVEQQLLTNDLLNKLISNTSSGISTAVSLIGKDVRAVSDEATLSGGQAKWAYELDGNAADAPDAQAPSQTASTAAASAPVTAPAHTPVRGSPETVAALAAQIIKKLDARSSRFDIELHPADLGRVDVRLEINQHGRVTAAMSFDNPQAAQELKSRAGDLQKALEQAGFDLSGGMRFDVADQGRGQQGRAEQWGDREPGAGFRGRAFQAALDTAGQADSGAASALNLRRGVRAGVDVRI